MAESRLKTCISRYQGLPRGVRLLALGLVTFALGLVCWQSWVGPEQERLLERQDRLSKLKIQVSTFATKAACRPRIDRELRLRKRQWQQAQSLLPESSQEVEELLACIERLAREAGIEVSSFASGEERLGEHLASRTLDLRLRGQFHSLMSFFSCMSRLKRLISLERLDLKAETGKSTGAVSLVAQGKVMMFRALTRQERVP